MLPLLKGEDAVTIHDNLRVSDASSSPATVLAYLYLHFQKLKAHELALFHSDQLPVWVTEFNPADMTPGHVFQGTWPVTLDVPAILPGALTVTQVTAPSIATKVTGPGSTKTSTSTASGTVRIEPYALAGISG